MARGDLRRPHPQGCQALRCVPQTELATKDVAAAASAIGLQIDVVEASDSREIEAAFRTLVRNRADALVVGPDPFFASRRLQLATLATRQRFQPSIIYASMRKLAAS